ncbi:phospholipase D zeta 1-like isoform X2 [Primulina tabacum]|uniref:phospholipase D zeta 1-like isoform X2 n=1 Tax=Primulina tabacum TaxID=48773 RepID=UPI003F5A2FE9
MRETALIPSSSSPVRSFYLTQSGILVSLLHLSNIQHLPHFLSFSDIWRSSQIPNRTGDEIIVNRVLEALYKRIMRAHNEKKCFRVIIVIPLLQGFQGGVDDSGAASVRAIMHWQYRTISRGNNSILHNLYDLVGPRMHDYISFYGLRAYGRLYEGGPLSSSQVYVHSKIMIIDDHTTLIGSANTDRSLLGSRDSEIGVLIEDKEFVDLWMGGKTWRGGKFASSLRLTLWSENLGLLVREVDFINHSYISG